MALENISKLFSERVTAISGSDIGYGIERFLQTALRSQRIQCRNDGGSGITIRAGTCALAQAVLVHEYDLRLFAQRELGCTIGSICVLL
ncbi:MAG: hypothetical protein A3C02_03260 [Candidatus Andersenbacteria bacterium RIFCSPHIGHO2_02_FULL_45_11]|uniref:Uncharacterized protein n=1 Tax=Candidatus Andersenbacteria bacterium RIFCSPHIGHO2_12_FULL_45_11 TaxID=1797281 RepID=A0A1G1X4B5_9BACT|nr:MAG: hypothetical protein A2805_03930 [Candidatus Andersenbacteria bacterium RIFCSPHIGHO2_01_FULL_46_36]OGY33461.1 MAG: hypothetical protein A3C02_03260 [Candidatus Andersenbacteria bacterium RIFCSPHIGHO2_02_FULL_45_11]OGY34848.1 MAG: hypothetical protein A3D99_02995 [Candidatus Andersenbacteria bacterium RIFCSPHIGHO2_12_FULL_45_11]